MDFKVNKMVTGDMDGDVVLFHVRVRKFSNIPLVKDDDYLVCEAQVKVSSEPVWRVILNNEKQLIVCCMPTVLKMYKIKKRSQSIKLVCVKSLTSSMSLFGHVELLGSNELENIRGQFEGGERVIADNIYNVQPRTNNFKNLEKTHLVVSIYFCHSKTSKFSFYNLDSLKESFSIPSKQDMPNYFKIIPSMAKLVSVHENGQINIYCLLKMKNVQKKLVSNAAPVDFFYFDSSEQLILTASSNDSVRVYSSQQLNFQSEFSGFRTKYQHGMSCICKLPQSPRLLHDLYLVSGSDGSLNIFKLS